MIKTLRSTLLFGLLGVAFLLAACGGNETPTVEEAATVEAHADAVHVANAPATEHPGHGAAHTDHAAHDDHPAALPAGELPSTSLYHLSSAWTDQDGSDLTLPELRGKPAVLVMFYGDCTTACPLLVRSAEQIEAALPADAREGVEFVMVTFATDADTPEKLKAYAQDKGLDRSNWHWLVGSPLQTRQLATLLGVQFRDVGNGMFAHSNIVTILDTAGVPVERLEGLGIDVAPAVDALTRSIR